MELDNSTKEQVVSVLGNIAHNVEISLVKGEENMVEGNEVETLFNEIVKIIPKIKLSVYDVKSDFAKKNKIEHTPAFMVHNPGENSSFIYYGVPAMHEFSVFIEAIRVVGNKDSDLSSTIKDSLKSINKSLNLEIFVTPSCGFCPAVAIAGFRSAYENQNIHVNVIEGTHFRALVNEKGIRAVPRVFINEESAIEGSVSIEQFVDALKSA
jgi:glutaredoxin-like protein